jgi:hypothetical protein
MHARMYDNNVVPLQAKKEEALENGVQSIEANVLTL